LSKIKFCFVAGTAVVLAGGTTKAIENIRAGDYVKSYNERTGEVENKRVLQTFENTISELTTVTTSDGQEIVATPGHKFFANNHWVSAEDLRAGDILVNVNGQKVVVEKVQHEILEKSVKIYNFEVQDNHTYFVGGENGVVVHNAACGKEVHHIVERNQVKYSGFTKAQVNAPENLIELTKEQHKVISAFYSSKPQGYTTTFRASLRGKSFAEQAKIGRDILERLLGIVV
jgi:intein/homing endonuclease